VEHTTSFWQVHGVWFLIFMFLFPRITMLVATPFPVGCLAWVGWVFVPRIVAAILATHFYWDTNPVLCVFTWIFAVGGTGGTSSSGARAARCHRQRA
jgi:hypothetical protein